MHHNALANNNISWHHDPKDIIMNRFLFFPHALTVRKRTMFIAAVAFALFVVISCSTRHVPSLTALSIKYRPIKIATHIQEQPGSFAWSNDGRTLAFVKKGMINLYNVGSPGVRSIRLNGAHSISWSPENTLFVLAKDSGKDILCTIDRNSLEISETSVDAGAEAVYATDDNRHLLVLSKRIRQFSFGTEIALCLTSYKKDASTPKILYESTETYTIDKPDLRAMLAWTHAGLRPVDNSLLVIEHIEPPEVAPYSRVIMIDTVSGETTKISGRLPNTIFVSARWSPDGNMVALTRGDGNLEIRTVRTNQRVLYQSTPGFYPTWNPQGNIIYTGGNLVPLDGKEPEALLLNDAWSIALWSPDGTMLAASAEGDLWLFRDMSPVSDRPNAKRDWTFLK